jgi:DNA ligase-1
MNEAGMMHGEDWNGEDLTGWLATEKMNGCRAYWDGSVLWSRGGIAAKLPAAWLADLPAVPLDCELYDGTDGLYRCGAALKYGKFTPTMQLIVFDAPAAPGGWVERMQFARAAVARSAVAVVPAVTVCAGNGHALDLMRQVQAQGGEGLMMRTAGLAYRPGRTRDMLKVKYERH